MLLNMIKAVYEMLEDKPSEDVVRCARKVLEQIIADLEKDMPPPHTLEDLHRPDRSLDPEAQKAQEELGGG